MISHLGLAKSPYDVDEDNEIEKGPAKLPVCSVGVVCADKDAANKRRQRVKVIRGIQVKF
jgi:hypothetical protein